LIEPNVGVVGVVLPRGRVEDHRREMHRVAVGERYPALVVDNADGAVDMQQFWNGCPEPKVPEAICSRFRSS